MTPAPSRRPFRTEHLERVLAFCAAHPANQFPPGLRRRLLTTLTSGPGGVIELLLEGETGLVAVVADAVESQADCAILDFLGVRAGAARPALFSATLDAAEAFAKRGARSGIEVPLTPRWEAATPVATERGYHLAFASFDMETPEMAPPTPCPLPGPGWRWATAGPDDAEPYYRALAITMGEAPGFYLGAPDLFRQNLAQHQGTDELLWCGEAIAGFACAKLTAGDLGYVSLIGRHPDFRGQGLGPRLLTRAMNRLAHDGARRFGLDVTASNEAALDLYLRFGFEVTQSIPTYRRHFRAR